jgi:hypothetical protein
MSNDAVRQLAQDGPFRPTLFAKSGDANWLIPWHQNTALPLAKRLDDPEWASWSRKEAVLYAHAPGVLSSRLYSRDVAAADSFVFQIEE